MIVIGIVLAIILGAGGAAVVADGARPGDVLFGLDQTVEKIELSLSGENRKDELRLKFANERLGEIKEIIDEDRVERDDAGDGADRPDDEIVSGRIISDKSRMKIETGIQSIASFLGDIDNAELNQALGSVIQSLNKEIESFPGNTKIEVRDDRFEVRNDNGRVRIDVKDDGEIKVKSETDKSGRNVENGEDDSDDDDLNEIDDADDDDKDDADDTADDRNDRNGSGGRSGRSGGN